MEIFVENPGFSHIVENIIGNLDVRSLLNCRLVNSTWRSYIDTSKYLWRNLIYQFKNLNCEQQANCVASWKRLIANFYSIEELKVFIGFLLKIQRVHLTSKNVHYEICQFNCFEMACKFGDPLLLSLLVNGQTIGKNGVLVASQYNKPENIKFLMENCQSIDFNAKNYDGSTAMHYACADGNLDIVQTLMDRGIMLNETNFDGRTALHEACYHGQVRIVHFLVSNRFNVKAMDHNERTPLHEACENPCVEMVQLLIDNGSDVNADDDDGKTPLHEACANGYLEIVKLLLEKGAQVNALCNDLNTALHVACEEGHLEIVDYLLQVPFVKVNDENAFGETPLSLAIDNQHLKELILNAEDE